MFANFSLFLTTAALNCFVRSDMVDSIICLHVPLYSKRALICWTFQVYHTAFPRSRDIARSVTGRHGHDVVMVLS